MSLLAVVKGDTKSPYYYVGWFFLIVGGIILLMVVVAAIQQGMKNSRAARAAQEPRAISLPADTACTYCGHALFSHENTQASTKCVVLGCPCDKFISVMKEQSTSEETSKVVEG
jgi:hypothetical protein